MNGRLVTGIARLAVAAHARAAGWTERTRAVVRIRLLPIPAGLTATSRCPQLLTPIKITIKGLDFVPHSPVLPGACSIGARAGVGIIAVGAAIISVARV